MLKSCRDTHIANIQCKLASTVKTFNLTLGYGKKDECLCKDIKIVSSYLNILKCFKTFDNEPTMIAKIEFSNPNNDTISLNIKIDTYDLGTYNGSGDGYDIARYFYNTINNTVSTPEFYAVWDNNNTLYIYSYDSSVSNSSTLTISDTNYATGSLSSDYQKDIISIWNCITEDDVCNMIKHCYKVLPERCF